MNVIQYKLNLPEDVKAWVKRTAKRNLRSQSAQIIMCLPREMAKEAAETEGVGRE